MIEFLFHIDMNLQQELTFSTVNASNPRIHGLNASRTLATSNTTTMLCHEPSTMGRTTTAIVSSSTLPGVDIVIYEELTEQKLLSLSKNDSLLDCIFCCY